MATASAANSRTNGLMRWGIVIAATAILAVASGGRFLIGVIFDEVRAGFSISYTTLGVIVSLNVLVVGVVQPLVGWLVDRLAARLVAAVGLGLLGLGLIVTGRAATLLELVLGYVVLVALGLAAVSPVTVTPLVAGWFVKRRATALSIVNAGGSLGQLAIVPALAVMVDTIGWHRAYVALGVGLMALGVPLILWLLRERELAEESLDDGLGCGLRTALGVRSFWQLSVGFFVCGFTMSWIMTYFVDYALVHGISRAVAASGLSLMGGMSILGTLITGWWADRAGRSLPLAVVYALRGAGFGLLFLAGSGLAFVLLAMAVIGFSWSSTTPLTSALCADIYGRRSLGAIFGLMFAIMPIGSAVGAALGGKLYDLTGSYTSSIAINVAAGLIAAAVVVAVRTTPIFDRPTRPATETVLAD